MKKFGRDERFELVDIDLLELECVTALMVNFRPP
jgi:hypothetical protein